MTDTSQFLALESELGWIGVTHQNLEIIELKFGPQTFSELATKFELNLVQPPRLNRIEETLAEKLALFASGQNVQFDEYRLRLQRLSAFQRRALEACITIPFGETRTYGELAIQLGSPKGSRAVGMAMKRNPIPLIIPCHRVVGKSNNSGGYSAGDGMDTKQRLLEMEKSNQLLFQ